jgi:hypothetical protein
VLSSARREKGRLKLRHPNVEIAILLEEEEEEEKELEN